MLRIFLWENLNVNSLNRAPFSAYNILHQLIRIRNIAIERHTHTYSMEIIRNSNRTICLLLLSSFCTYTFVVSNFLSKGNRNEIPFPFYIRPIGGWFPLHSMRIYFNLIKWRTFKFVSYKNPETLLSSSLYLLIYRCVLCHQISSYIQHLYTYKTRQDNFSQHTSRCHILTTTVITSVPILWFNVYNENNKTETTSYPASNITKSKSKSKFKPTHFIDSCSRLAKSLKL